MIGHLRRPNDQPVKLLKFARNPATLQPRKLNKPCNPANPTNCNWMEVYLRATTVVPPMRSTVSDANHQASSDPMSKLTSNLLVEPSGKLPTRNPSGEASGKQPMRGRNERADERSVRRANR